MAGQALHVVLILTLALYVINVGYGFEGTGTKLGEYRFVSASLRVGKGNGGGVATTQPANRFAESWLGQIRVPLPSNYVQGIDRQKLDFELRPWSYLRGEWRRSGWWYYYVYALAVKEPIGTWLLALLAVLSTLFSRGSPASWRDELLLLAPAAVVFVLVSSQTGFNHHMRYVLPSFPFTFIWISKLARSMNRDHCAFTLTAGAALAWSVGSSVYYYPHSLSYFNELAGGPAHGYKHLLDSNIDWGQDLLLLKRWLDKHPEVQPIGLAYSQPKIVFDPAHIGMKYNLPPPGPDSLVLDRSHSTVEIGPLPGWYAVFVRAMRERDRRYAYFEHFEPVEMLGYTVRIYHISLDDANRVRSKLGLSEIGPGEMSQAPKGRRTRS
jgi:hypothetical protein